MSLSKQQSMAAAGAGVFVLLAGALGWLLWDARAQRIESEERLEAEQSALASFVKAKIFPSPKSIAAVKTNETAYAEWMQTALETAAAEDRKPAAEVESPSVFKQRLQTEVRRMGDLPGLVNGKLAADNFWFGFEQYLGEGGVLPAAEEVPRLSEQLAFISCTVDAFAQAGVGAVRSVTRVAPEKPKEETGRNNRKKNKKAASAEEEKTTYLDYKFDVLAAPAAVAGVFNRITSAKRFVTIEEFSFAKSADDIVTRIGEREAKFEEGGSKSTRRRSSRRRAADTADGEIKPAKVDDSIASDPELDAPYSLQLTLRVWDFGTGEAACKGEGEN